MKGIRKLQNRWAVAAVCVALFVTLTSCRSAGSASPVTFDPLSLGPSGSVLKKFLERPVKRAGLVMKARFEASLPNMKKQGVMETEKRIDEKGHVTYEMKSFQGDDTIKKQVIARYISAEQDSSATGNGAAEIQAQNYRFKYKRSEKLGERQAEVFEVQPRRSAVGLFKGEIWLEEGSGLPLRFTGRLVKNPSVIFKTNDFTQDFVVKEGQAYESVLTIDSNTRLVGKVIMQITCSDYRRTRPETKGSE
jgi:hypothetical protein